MELKEVLKQHNVTDKDVITTIEKKFDDFNDRFENSDCLDIIWDKTVDKYHNNISKLKIIMNEKNIATNIEDKMLANLDRFINMCQNPEFHIAFVGAIKAGKSTLINALLGEDLASTSVTPETASLTKFRASKNENYVKVSFYTKDEWDNVWSSVEDIGSSVFLEEYEKLNAEKEKHNWIGHDEVKETFKDTDDLKDKIKDWTSSQRATHYFVKEVEVGLKNSKIPEGVIYVDTPGLDDPVKYRSDITRDYIARANAVLVCVKADALTGPELCTLYNVFSNSISNPEKIYVVGTQLDTLNVPVTDWEKQKEEWKKHLSRDVCFGNASLVESNLIAVASYVHNLIRKFDSLSEDTIDFELDPIFKKFRLRGDVKDNLEEMDKNTNISILESKLNNNILNKHRKILLNDITSKYTSLKDDVLTFAKAMEKTQIDMLRSAEFDLETIREQIEKSNKALEIEEKKKLTIETAVKKINAKTDEEAKQLYSDIKRLVNN